MVWITTPAGKWMPCDAAPVVIITEAQVKAGGRLIRKDGTVISKPALGDEGYTPHWGTCPARAQFKKPKAVANAR
jgi:hypothetical protein